MGINPDQMNPHSEKLVAFEKDLALLINRHSLESINATHHMGTPDYILAGVMVDALKSFTKRQDAARYHEKPREPPPYPVARGES